VEVEFGFSGWQPFDFDIFPFHAGRPTGAERFEASLFGRESRGVMDLGLYAFLAVLHLSFCIYSIEKAIAETLDRIADPLVLDDVDADTGDHNFHVTGKTPGTNNLRSVCGPGPHSRRRSRILHAAR